MPLANTKKKHCCVNNCFLRVKFEDQKNIINKEIWTYELTYFLVFIECNKYEYKIPLKNEGYVNFHDNLKC